MKLPERSKEDQLVGHIIARTVAVTFHGVVLCVVLLSALLITVVRIVPCASGDLVFRGLLAMIRAVPVRLFHDLRLSFGTTRMVHQAGTKQAVLILIEAGMAALGHVAQGLEQEIRARIA